MMTEETIRKSITDKLIEVAKHPEMRKEFCITYGNSATYCYENHPMMCDIEQYVFISYYGCEILHTRSEEECLEYYNKYRGIVEQMSDEIDRYRSLAFLDNMMASYYEKKKDYRRTKYHLLLYLLSVINTPEGAEREDIARLKKILHKTGDTAFLESLQKYDVFLKEFNPPSITENGKESYNEYISSAIDRIIEITIEEFCQDETMEDEKSHLWFGLVIIQAYNIGNKPKRRSPQKGEFDYYYNKAEKGDAESQRMIARCYRDGDIVSKNERLANFWQAMADEHRYIE